MDKKFDKLKSKIIKCYSQCFNSSDNLKFMGQYFIEKFKNPYCSFEHKKLADELYEAIFNKKNPPNIRYNAVLLLKNCMQTSNYFLINYVELNVIEKFGKIAFLTKKPKYQHTFFGNLHDEIYSPLFFQEVLTCILLWAKVSSYYEQILRELQKQKVQFNLNAQQYQQSNSQHKSDQNLSKYHQRKYSSKCLPMFTQQDRVKLKLQLLQDTLYFLYSCFVLEKMIDEISQILIVCNDIISSMELEKESLKLYKSNTEQVGQISKLQLLLQHMNQNYTNGEPIKLFMKNYKQILAEVLNITNEQEEEQKIRKEYKDLYQKSIKSQNIIYSLNSFAQLDNETQQTGKSNPSLNSNINLSLNHQIITTNEISKQYDKSPFYANQIYSQSLQSFPPSPRYNLGSLNDEKLQKQTPSIYGMLKQLRQEKNQRTMNNIKSLSQFEEGTPETKCATFQSINELRENKSQFSSHDSSPLIFSTADPLYFEQVDISQNNYDSLMEVEYSNAQQQQQQKCSHQRRNTIQDIQSCKKQIKQANESQTTSNMTKNQNKILQFIDQQNQTQNSLSEQSKQNYSHINDVKYQQHYSQYQDFSSIIQDQKLQQLSTFHNQKQQNYSKKQQFNCDELPLYYDQQHASQQFIQDKEYTYKQIDFQYIGQDQQQKQNNVPIQNKYKSKYLSQNKQRISKLIDEQNMLKNQIDEDGIIYRNCKKQAKTIIQNDNLYSQFNINQQQYQEQQQQINYQNYSQNLNNASYEITLLAQERSKLPIQPSIYTQSQNLQNQQNNCLYSSQIQYNSLRLPFLPQIKQQQQQSNIVQKQTNILPYQHIPQYSQIQNNYSQIINQQIPYNDSQMEAEIPNVGSQQQQKQNKLKNQINNNQNQHFFDSNLDNLSYQTFTSQINNIANQNKQKNNYNPEYYEYSNTQQCYMSNSQLFSKNIKNGQSSDQNLIDNRCSLPNLTQSLTSSRYYSHANLNQNYYSQY